MSEGKETIAILGGTGDLGTGLAIRWSKAGYKIVIGSRTLEKAQTAVAALQEISPETPADAMDNLDAAAAGDIVVLTVPAEHQISTLLAPASFRVLATSVAVAPVVTECALDVQPLDVLQR